MIVSWFSLGGPTNSFWLSVGGPVVQHAVLRYLPGRRGRLQSPTLLLPDLDSSQSTHRTVPRLKVRL